MRVLAAMSGGVDSSVAAALMAQEGHDVIGATLKLWQGEDGSLPTRGCCTLADSDDARRVAATIGIPYYVLDATEEFRSGIVDPFISEYLAGRTPNPCIACNRVIKFDRLLRWAVDLECDLVVTGHYARVERGTHGYRLLRSLDAAKDQSYVLYMLGQRELEQVRFPVGSYRKDAVRAVAGELGLRTAHKRDSQDICFVGDDYRSFLRNETPQANRPGPVVDEDGATVGTHGGVADFTVGQRKGLGVTLGTPRYVQDILPASATIVVGPRRATFTGLTMRDTSWVSGTAPPSGSVQVQIRAHGDACDALLDGATVHFAEAQASVAAGQTAVVYRGQELLGGGTIDSAVRE
jgi:tRNA-specific 2-thiouridylase